MTSDLAIKVENLGKEYRLGTRQRYKSLRESLSGLFTSHSALRTPHSEKIWALKDVSFEIKRGEVVGIIGRNGAGKSTLLKILSQITEPTTGTADIYGRVGSLLEVGTGFHPELTGRENIFLNGAILGMRRHEIISKFDEIVAFAEVEKFLDTAVKHYSSGMQMRLAFSVAAHLEPEILLVDEVLAVGDAQFQNKCMGKMGAVAKLGRTVFLVSHNMGAIKSLCERVLLIQDGHLVADGCPDHLVNRYLAAVSPAAATGDITDASSRSGTQEVLFRRVALQSMDGVAVSQVHFGQPFRIVMTVEARQPVHDLVLGVFISTTDGTRVTASVNTQDSLPAARLAAGTHVFQVDLNPTLLPRLYTLDLLMAHTDGRDIDFVTDVARFEGLRTAATGSDHYPWHTLHGFIRLTGRWHFGQGGT